MFTLSVTIKFSSAHSLRNYQGKCANIHGHTFTAQCLVRGSRLNSQGMVMDFHALEDLVEQITDEFDHRLINEHPSFTEEGLNPTAENLAGYIYEKLKDVLEVVDQSITVHEVTVWESDDAYASYREED
ncbi:6-carboxytetrahydropterin synthase QueD [Candidatus Contubernalis alkalaceticus]|nr:6-carboxytetrahydropterin synthase QueD [Candidatus Contubernalis alkalaceticus]